VIHSDFIQQFHFLRPLWLLAIIPAALLVVYFWQKKSSSLHWRGAINEQLLGHLIDGGQTKISRWPWLSLLFAWIIAAIAIAGPSWEKLPQPVHQRQDALVIAFDLSLSMFAEDTKPSRLIRARHKVLDILTYRNEGLTGLIAYSGDAHIASPLTDDTATIANLTPALSPDMMPVYGSNPAAAIKLAKQLFTNTGINSGRILLITDGITDRDINAISDELNGSGLQLSIMGIGSSDGAPIPTSDGFLKDRSGNIIIPQLNRPLLEQLAKRSDGRYTDASINDNDIKFLLPPPLAELEGNTLLTERQFDQWQDRGPLLALLLLPLALLGFRRGWLLALPLVFILQPQPGYAFEWQDLWLRPDQQAAQKLQQGDTKAAAEQFQDPLWRGAAHYKSGSFEQAAENFSHANTADAHYNRGNALARAGKLDEAIKAYDDALKLQPDMDDAKANQELLEQIKKQQEQQQQDQQDQQEQNQQQDDNQNQQQSEQNPADKNNADSQQSEQQDRDQAEQQPSDQSQQDGSQQSKAEKNQPEQDQAQPTDGDNPESKEKPEQTNQQKAQQQDQQSDSDQDPSAQQPAQAAELSPEERAKQQTMEQWLRQIPDDPSGLLRRKFHYESRLRQQQGELQQEQSQW